MRCIQRLTYLSSLKLPFALAPTLCLASSIRRIGECNVHRKCSFLSYPLSSLTSSTPMISQFPFFLLSSVTDAYSFMLKTRAQTKRLMAYVERDQKNNTNNGEDQRQKWDPLLRQLSIPVIEAEIWRPWECINNQKKDNNINENIFNKLNEEDLPKIAGKQKLKTTPGLQSERLNTCLVPFQRAVDIIIERLPAPYNELAHRELEYETSVRLNNAKIKGQLKELLLKKEKMAILGRKKNEKNKGVGDEYSNSNSIEYEEELTVFHNEIRQLQAQLQPLPQNIFIGYLDEDLYTNRKAMGIGVSVPKLEDNKEPTNSWSLNHKITPVVAILGHIDHGKTTLLDTVMACNMCDREAGNITQAVRCFTVNVDICYKTLHDKLQSWDIFNQKSILEMQNRTEEKHVSSIKTLPLNNSSTETQGTSSNDNTFTSNNEVSPIFFLPSSSSYPSHISFVDTPGHKAFAEMRFYSLMMANVLVIIISLNEGVKNQTLEIIYTALNTDKPTIIVFNKADMYQDVVTGLTDVKALTAALVTVMGQLKKEGVMVKLIGCEEDLQRMRNKITMKPSANSICDAEGDGSLEGVKGRHVGDNDRCTKNTSCLNEATFQCELAKYLVKGLNRVKAVEEGSTKRKGNGRQSMLSVGGSFNIPSDAVGSIFNPVLKSGVLKKRCLGVCISGKTGNNLSLLLSIIRVAAELDPPKAVINPVPIMPFRQGNVNNSLAFNPYLGISIACQAQILETSKHVEQNECAELHDIETREKRNSYLRSNNCNYGKKNRSGRYPARRYKHDVTTSDILKEMRQSSKHGMQESIKKSQNYKSTPNTVIAAVVRSGILYKGMSYVADQSYGTIDILCDYWGKPIAAAPPGTAVVIIDRNNQCGCPGVGTHVMCLQFMSQATGEAWGSSRNGFCGRLTGSMIAGTAFSREGGPTAQSSKKREGRSQLLILRVCEKIYEYRRHLQWFVETFPQHTKLMKPEGMDVSFKHLGNYGQIQKGEEEKTLHYKLLFGTGPSDRQGGSRDEKLDLLSAKASPNKLPFLLQTGDDKKELNEGKLRNNNNSQSDSNAEAAINPSTTVEGTPSYIQSRWEALQPKQSEMKRNMAWLKKRQDRQQGKGEEEDLPDTLLGQNEFKMENEEDDSVQGQFEEGDDDNTEHCRVVGVFLKVDSWHSARSLLRDITRLSTKHIIFTVLGCRFGELNTDDVKTFLNSCKVFICYRVPPLQDSKTFQYLNVTAGAWMANAMTKKSRSQDTLGDSMSANITTDDITHTQKKNMGGLKFYPSMPQDTEFFKDEIMNGRSSMPISSSSVHCHGDDEADGIIDPQLLPTGESHKCYFLETDIYANAITYIKSISIVEHEAFVREKGGPYGYNYAEENGGGQQGFRCGCNKVSGKNRAVSQKKSSDGGNVKGMLKSIGIGAAVSRRELRPCSWNP